MGVVALLVPVNEPVKNEVEPPTGALTVAVTPASKVIVNPVLLVGLALIVQLVLFEPATQLPACTGVKKPSTNTAVTPTERTAVPASNAFLKLLYILYQPSALERFISPSGNIKRLRITQQASDIVTLCIDLNTGNTSKFDVPRYGIASNFLHMPYGV